MFWPAVLLTLVVSHARAQLTAQSSVAPELRECYLNGTLLNRNNLPPTTINVLIDIIQKIEDNPNVNLDLRQLSALLLHTYRQDGIEYHQPDVTAAANVLPYAPTFHSFHRHRLVLTRLIPNNLLALAPDTLDSSLKCAVHHMLSTTVDARVRGDEGACNQLAQYRALRTPRSARRRRRRDSSISDDVEVLDKAVLATANLNGKIRQFNPNDDVEFTDFASARSERQVLGDSQCPLLGGVVHTTWGAVSAGNLIAGIAAGAESQRVSITELSRNSVTDYNNIQEFVTSIYPATLSGDLAEAALIQGTERGSTTISVGAGGGWNSTQARKHYMLQSRVNVEMTDPEIRGGIDGFVLGSSITSVLSSYSSLRLSQLLDMYYTARNGVFASRLRACNRRDLSQEFISNDNLVAETTAFAAGLDSNMPLRGTITGGLQELITNAVNNFQTYTTNNLYDVNCLTTEASSADFRLKSNLYLVVDSAWQYETIYPAVSYILDNIEVGKFGSSVTLLSGFDGSVVINKTFSLADFHSQYTLARHQSLLLGVNLQNTLTNIRTLLTNELENERSTNYVGGNSTVLLFLLNSANLQNNDLVLEQARALNETVPDLRVLFATAANQFDVLWNLVRDMNNDIHTISLSANGLNVDTTLAPVLSRISSAGRRIVNPVCGSQWNGENLLSGTRQFDDFVEPGYVNFYSISPNYFYNNRDNRRVRISRSGAGIGNLIVCHSRVIAQPRQNATTNIGDDNAVQCQTLGTSGNVEINLQNACDGYWTVNSCPFFHISVQSSVEGTTATSALCTDQRLCRFPYNNRYQVQIEDLGCYSSGINIGSNFVLLFASLSVVLFKLM